MKEILNNQIEKFLLDFNNKYSYNKIYDEPYLGDNTGYVFYKTALRDTPLSIATHIITILDDANLQIAIKNNVVDYLNSATRNEIVNMLTDKSKDGFKRYTKKNKITIPDVATMKDPVVCRRLFDEVFDDYVKYIQCGIGVKDYFGFLEDDAVFEVGDDKYNMFIYRL